METLVQKLRARTGLLTIAEVMRMTKVRFQAGWIDLFTYKGLSRLLSADSANHDTSGTADRWFCTSEVIGVTRDSKFGEEGGIRTPVRVFSP